MTNRRAAWLTIVLFSVLAPESAAQETIGYVLSLHGHWRVAGAHGRPLARGGALHSGESVEVVPPYGAQDSVVVVGSGEHGPAVGMRCSDPGRCDHPLSLAALTPAAPARGSDLLAAAFSLLREAEPELYAVFGSRGAGARLHDAVIAVAAGRADLGPVLRELRPGGYRVRVSPVHREDREGFGAAEAEIRVERGAAGAPLWMTGLPAGLSTVEATNLDSRGDGAGETAWVLLVPESSYKDLARQFGDAEALTRQWGESASADDVRAFLRACLDHLTMAASRGGHSGQA